MTKHPRPRRTRCGARRTADHGAHRTSVGFGIGQKKHLTVMPPGESGESAGPTVSSGSAFGAVDHHQAERSGSQQELSRPSELMGFDVGLRNVDDEKRVEIDPSLRDVGWEQRPVFWLNPYRTLVSGLSMGEQRHRSGRPGSPAAARNLDESPSWKALRKALWKTLRKVLWKTLRQGLRAILRETTLRRTLRRVRAGCWKALCFQQFEMVWLVWRERSSASPSY